MDVQKPLIYRVLIDMSMIDAHSYWLYRPAPPRCVQQQGQRATYHTGLDTSLLHCDGDDDEPVELDHMELLVHI